MEPDRQNFFNPQSSVWQLQQIPAQDLNFNAIYTVPGAPFIPTKGGLHYLAKDWQIGWFANYQSGQFLAPPVSTTPNFFQSEDIRVAGQPFYTQGVNINDHSSFNPATTQVLNPAAWAPCPAECGLCVNLGVLQRFPRSADADRERQYRPQFPVWPGGQIQPLYPSRIRQHLQPDLVAESDHRRIRRTRRGASSGIYSSGFGVINTYLPTGSIYGAAPYLQGRTGTLVARFSF